MSGKRSSYYIENHGSSPPAIEKGLAWLIQTGATSALIAVNALAILDSIAPVAGEAFVKTLKKDKTCSFKRQLGRVNFDREGGEILMGWARSGLVPIFEATRQD